MAWAMGSAGKTGTAAAAGGVAGVGRAAGGAAMSPLRKAADSAKSSFRDGARAAVGHTGGHIVPAPGSSPPDAAAENGPPAWARAMRQRQTLSTSASLAAHTVRSGDGNGAGASIDTREKD
jgi:type IV secretion system protein TrbL